MPGWRIEIKKSVFFSFFNKKYCCGPKYRFVYKYYQKFGRRGKTLASFHGATSFYSYQRGCKYYVSHI